MQYQICRFAVAFILAALMVIPLHCVKKGPNNPENVIEELVPAIVTEGVPVKTTRLKDRMKELKINGFSIAVIRNGKIAWAKGYGENINTSTLYQAGSISKPLTAMAVMHLVQEGTIDVDADANKYLKSWKIPKSKFNENKPVTVRMLLNHSSGLTNSAPMFAKDEAAPKLVELLKGGKQAGGAAAITVDNEPGKEFSYTNNGYAALQVMIEDVTGKPFADFMKETVISPLGMTHSRFEQPLSKELLSQAALPYDYKGWRMEKGPYTIGCLAAGGLWTTPSDLATFAINIQDVLAGRSETVISQKTARQMLEPGKGDYGLGFGVVGKAPKFYFTHGGGTIGYLCNMLASEQGDGVVVMTSSENGGQLISDIVRTLAQAYGWTELGPLNVTKDVKIDPRSIEDLIGYYRVGPFSFHVTNYQNRLFICSSLEDGKFELFPKGNSSFYVKVFPAQFDFILGEDGKVEKLILSQGGHNQVGSRNKPIVLRSLDSGVKIEPIRPYFDPKRKYDSIHVFKDGEHGASGTVNVKGESIEWQYNSGDGWGCGISLPCNVPPLGDSATVDLRGYRYLCFDAKLERGKAFASHMYEYKSLANNLQKYIGVNGSDAEAFFFDLQKGTGKWSSYRIDMTDLDRRSSWGNQKGNRIFDLQSISGLDFQIGSRQGKGIMEIKQVRFEKE
jgi:CubicO group peptidase (beta-lactamase class C family)